MGHKPIHEDEHVYGGSGSDSSSILQAAAAASANVEGLQACMMYESAPD
jgi:hypothetical protein